MRQIVVIDVNSNSLFKSGSFTAVLVWWSSNFGLLHCWPKWSSTWYKYLVRGGLWSLSSKPNQLFHSLYHFFWVCYF